VSVAKKKQQWVASVDRDLEDLIPKFLNNRENDIVKMTADLKTENFNEIARIGHSIKGSAGGYGFDDLGLIGADIENAARAAESDRIRELLEDMRSYLDEVVIEYKG
jgi:HPt (histidine-containing phosphotransfer) domain-containing protein